MVSPFPKLLTGNPTTKSVMTKASYQSARPAMNSISALEDLTHRVGRISEDEGLGTPAGSPCIP